jgi:sodium/proline symporter
MHRLGVAGLFFFATLAATFGTAILGSLRARPFDGEEDLAGRRLNRWLIGLSAGATGNSGFIVTGAVGLGYAGGVHWLLMPLAWMLGDLVYWWVFPARLNRLAREAKAVTLSEMLTFDLSGRLAKVVSILVALLLVGFLATYTSAQWLAGRKFLSGVFDMNDLFALIFFSATIVVYSALGGFRGSVYADTLQALIRIVATTIAITAVIWFAAQNPASFSHNIKAAGSDFLNPFPWGTAVAALGFIVGYAAAAIGFGLGQPQIVTRYFAGSSPQETQSAWWIYIGFVQATWIAMTTFGIILRGVMPNIADPETGFSLFFQQNMGAVVCGIIFADVYATIASTSNSLLVAIGQTLYRDIICFRQSLPERKTTTTFAVIFLIGLATIGLSLVLPGNVFSLAIGSISTLGAAVGGPVMIKVLRWRHSAASLLAAILAGMIMACTWDYLGYGSRINEAAVGLACSLLANWLFVTSARAAPSPKKS